MGLDIIIDIPKKALSAVAGKHVFLQHRNLALDSKIYSEFVIPDACSYQLSKPFANVWLQNNQLEFFNPLDLQLPEFMAVHAAEGLNEKRPKIK